jgi:hypothetical protein
MVVGVCNFPATFLQLSCNFPVTFLQLLSSDFERLYDYQRLSGAKPSDYGSRSGLCVLSPGKDADTLRGASQRRRTSLIAAPWVNIYQKANDAYNAIISLTAA